MKINFKKIRFKNILSYGDKPTEYEFENGIDLITGKNGQGKSSILDALFYGLYGKPYRKIKNNSLVNKYTNKKLEVELYFNEYKIIRGQKPNIFVIYKNTNGEYIEIPEKASVKEYQNYFIEEIFKINETVFRQLISISTNSNQSKTFMELTQKEKEYLFQVVTDTSIFTQLNDLIKLKINDAKIVLKEKEYEKNILQNSISSEEIMLEKAKKQNEDLKKHHKNNILQTQNEISLTKENILKYEKALKVLEDLKKKYDNENKILENLNKELENKENELKKQIEEKILLVTEEYDKKIQDLSEEFYSIEYDEEIKALEEEQKHIRIDIKNLQNKIQFIQGAKQSSIICSNCNEVNYLVDIEKDEIEKYDGYLKELEEKKQKLDQITLDIFQKNAIIITLKEEYKAKFNNDKEYILAEKHKKIQEIKNSSNNTELEEIKKKISDKQKILYGYKEKLLKSNHIKKTLAEYQQNFEFYISKLNELKNIKPVEINENSLKEKKETLDTLNKIYESISKKIDDYTFILELVSENNLKGKVISQTVPFLNKGINYFLEKFSLNDFNFILDKNFKEQIISRKNNTEFNGLSSGQKMRISFSIMFSFLRLIEEKNGVSTNLLFLDEILDSSLDTLGREELLHILKNEFSNTKDIIIISHNDEVKNKLELIDRLVEVKQDKFSHIIIKEV